MAFQKLTAFTKKVADLADQPTLTPTELKAQFDAAPDELRVYFNNLIDALNSAGLGDISTAYAGDLNALTTANGLYFSSTGGTNRPGTHNGYVIVRCATPSSFVSQTFIDAISGTVYQRVLNSGTWGSWFKLASTLPGATTNATPLNGWAGTIQCNRNDLGQVRLFLDVTSGTVANLTTIANLPVGARPTKKIPISLINAVGGTVLPSSLYLKEDGNIVTTTGNGLTTSVIYNAEIVYYDATSL